MTAVKWGFSSRFRASAYGWRGTRLAVDRLDEAVAEIRRAAKQDPALAAEGSVLLLEKISPAIRHIDSSSGALGNAVHAIVEHLVPIIATAQVSAGTRAKWLDRLFDALQDDDPPYLESLGEYWGDLCASPALAAVWSDNLAPTVKRLMAERRKGSYAYFTGTTACFSALFKAERHDELLDILASDPKPWWSNQRWAAKVLAARGQVDEAIAFAERHRDLNTPESTIAAFAEDTLLKAGRRQEAYERYAIAATYANSKLATHRALARKYPEIEPARLLADLIASTPGEDGKWFATAKSLKQFNLALDLALDLARRSPCDPKTLMRAARDHIETQPGFSAETALMALHWMSLGHGYDLTNLDVRDAHWQAMASAHAAGCGEAMRLRIDQLLARDSVTVRWMRQCLGL